MTYEFLDSSPLSRLRSSIGIDHGFQLEQIDGGFTSSEKYVVSDTENIPVSFIKIVPKNAGDELAAITAEIQNYELLTELRLTGPVFPNVIGKIDTNDYRGIILEYYDNVSWGGPWSDVSIRSVHALLARIHGTELTDTHRKILQATKDKLIPMSEIYREALPAFQDRTTIVNSRGQTIFSTPDEQLFQALFEDEKTPDTAIPVLIAQDVNKYNICIGRDGETHIVDPVYLNIGNPYQDFLNIAHDIIQELPEGSSEIDTVKKFFHPDDKHNQHVLNGIAYGLLAIRKTYDHNPQWMDYQQDALMIKLKLWYDQI